MTHDPKWQKGHDAAVDALKNPTPELVEAVAIGLAEEAGEYWDADDYTDTLSGNDPADMRFGFRDSAKAALATAAAYLFVENAKESTEQFAQNANCANLKG